MFASVIISPSLAQATTDEAEEEREDTAPGVE